MNLSTLLEELLVVIVLYRTRAEKSTTYLSILKAHTGSYMFPEILFYDNSVFPAEITGKGIHYIHDPRNRGVSTAYNSAANWAAKRGKNWLLFLDQDSTVPPDLFIHLLNAVRSLPDTRAFVPSVIDKEGLLSPFRFGARARRIKHSPKTVPLARYRFINSGLFIQRSAFFSAGGYDEDIPLDFSDISFGSTLQRVTDHVAVVQCDVRQDFSGSHPTHADDALARFRSYCAGAFALGKKSDRMWSMGLQTIARAAHLSCRYRDTRFLKSFFRQLVYG